MGQISLLTTKSDDAHHLGFTFSHYKDVQNPSGGSNDSHWPSSELVRQSMQWKIVSTREPSSGKCITKWRVFTFVAFLGLRIRLLETQPLQQPLSFGKTKDHGSWKDEVC